MIPMVDRDTYLAERFDETVRRFASNVGLPERYIRSPQKMERMFEQAAMLGITHEPKTDPKGIGRRAPTTTLDVALLIKTGALSRKPDPLCPHRQDWDWCPDCGR